MNKAMYIQFNPIRAEPINLPTNIKFVISNSMTPSEKHSTLGTRYNKRVSECRMALRMLVLKLGIP